jgi:hypothetical protein
MATWSRTKNKYWRGGKLFEVVMIADREGNIGGESGAQINLPIGQSSVNKFGYTGADVNGTSTVWDGNATTASYPYPTAGVVAVSSSSGDDTGEAVQIQGLDGDYNVVEETINVGSTGSTTFSRVFRASKVDASNVGTITINVGGALAAQILPGNGQTLMAVYTIPAGKTGYLLKFQGSSDKSAAVQFKLFSREFGKASNLKGQWGTQGGNPITYDYPIPISFPEKTDIRVDIATSSSCGCGAIFDLLLVDN